MAIPRHMGRWRNTSMKYAIIDLQHKFKDFYTTTKIPLPELLGWLQQFDLIYWTITDIRIEHYEDKVEIE